MKDFSWINRIWVAPVVPSYICRAKVFRGGDMEFFSNSNRKSAPKVSLKKV